MVALGLWVSPPVLPSSIADTAGNIVNSTVNMLPCPFVLSLDQLTKLKPTMSTTNDVRLVSHLPHFLTCPLP